MLIAALGHALGPHLVPVILASPLAQGLPDHLHHAALGDPVAGLRSAGGTFGFEQGDTFADRRDGVGPGRADVVAFRL